jgi:hypothetical protein
LASQAGQASVVGFLLDYEAKFNINRENMTFVDLAIQFKQQKVLFTAIAHDRWEEMLDLSSFLYKTPFLGIIQMCPQVTHAVLERCVTRIYSYEKDDKKFSVIITSFQIHD